MSIVPALLEDLSVVAEIAHRTIERIYPHYYPRGAVAFFHRHHSEDGIREDILQKRVFLCLDEQGNAVGTVTIRANEINRLFVLPEHQGRGFGRELMDFAEGAILQRSSEIVLDASLPAKGIYLKRGYRAVEFHCFEVSDGDYLCYDVMIKCPQEGKETVS